jgi:hypothetical protein
MVAAGSDTPAIYVWEEHIWAWSHPPCTIWPEDCQVVRYTLVILIYDMSNVNLPNLLYRRLPIISVFKILKILQDNKGVETTHPPCTIWPEGCQVVRYTRVLLIYDMSSVHFIDFYWTICPFRSIFQLIYNFKDNKRVLATRAKHYGWVVK